MNGMYWTILKVTAALAAGPLIGGLIAGLDRKLTARIQGRIGPPVLQPFYDLAKLFGKQPLAVNQLQIVYAYLHLAFMLAVVVLLAMGQDLLMILFAHAFSTIALILGGLSVRSPYSRIGSQRKIMQMLGYEPLLVMAIIGVYLAGAAGGHPSFTAARAVMAGGKPLLLSMPLIFLTLVVAASVKLQKSPFDVSSSHHAHQEIVKGVTIEYSGPFLGLLELTHLYEVFVLFGILAAFWWNPLPVGLVLAAAAFVAIIFMDNLTARLSTFWMVAFLWSVPMLLALANLVWLYMALPGGIAK